MNERHQDFELLQRFTRQGQQSAFADVVRRHLDLVFATALRKVDDPGVAQEIAQNVFSALARKAWRFAPDDSLPAWLHKATLLECKSWLRGELGRRRREQTAAELGTTMKTSEEQPAFAALVPLLDEALLSLREKDRTALLLRFYESQSLRDVGTAFGITEDTARKRVESALEKLTEFFQRRGFKTVSVATATAALQHTATSASSAVAGTVITAALKVAPPALVGLAALLARLASLTRPQTAAVCVALAVVPVGWQLNERRSAGEDVRQLQTQLFAAQNEGTTLQTDIERLRSTSARLEQSVTQANEAAARAAESAQAYEAWKQRTRGLLVATDYGWDDNSPFVRIPKAILPEVSERSDADPFLPPGVVRPYARELMGLTPKERQALEATLQKHFLDRDTTIYETNSPINTAHWVGVQLLATNVFMLPAEAQATAEKRGEVTLAELRRTLGEERWPLAEVRLEKSPGGYYRTGNQRTRLHLEGALGQSLQCMVFTDSKGALRWHCSLSVGGSSGSMGGELSEFLPEDHPNRTLGPNGTPALGRGVVSEGLRLRAAAWFQEQATERVSRKETP